MALGAVETGQFRADLDVALFAFEFYSIMLGYPHHKRLLQDPKAEALVRAAFQRFIASSRRA